jgi:hypothetical protein
MSNLPPPLSPPDCDLRGYDYMPMHCGRLFASAFFFATRRNPAALRAALQLWWAAWQQCPAGSLPNNEWALCSFAGLGNDMRAWGRVKDVALHGFKLCSDGRFYHKVICDLAKEAWERRAKARIKKAHQRAEEASSQADRDIQADGQRPASGRPAAEQQENGRRDVVAHDRQVPDIAEKRTECPQGRPGSVPAEGKGRDKRGSCASSIRG